MAGPLKVTLNLNSEIVYDNSTARVACTAVDFNGVAVTAGVTTNVNIYDLSGNYAVQNVALAYDPVDAYWFYDWQNTLPGVWKVEVTFTGGGATPFVTMAEGALHILPPPVAPTGLLTPIQH